MEIPPGHRIVVASGQLGIAPDARIPHDVGEQTRLCFANIRAVLAAARMHIDDIVRIDAFVTERAHLAAYMQVRDEIVGNPPPASTLMIVTGFSRPEFQVEVEIIAAAP